MCGDHLVLHDDQCGCSRRRGCRARRAARPAAAEGRCGAAETGAVQRGAWWGWKQTGHRDGGRRRADRDRRRRGTVLSGHRADLCYQNPSATPDFRPSFFVDVWDYLDVKIEAVAAHRNQLDKSYLRGEQPRGLATFLGARDAAGVAGHLAVHLTGFRDRAGARSRRDAKCTLRPTSPVARRTAAATHPSWW
jgi:LmbE family N-acetylglucosaminyl deacetylase